VSYFVRTTTKRQILAAHAGKDESFGNALAEYLNAQKAPVVSVSFEGPDVTVVFHTPSKSDK
jgi:hypothetical protein